MGIIELYFLNELNKKLDEEQELIAKIAYSQSEINRKLDFLLELKEQQKDRQDKETTKSHSYKG